MRKLQLPKFETVQDNDKPIDWQYVKDTYKEYFNPKHQSLRRIGEMQLTHISHVATMHLIFTITYALWAFHPDARAWLDNAIPNSELIFHIVALLCIISVTMGYIGEGKRIKKKMKIILDNTDCEREDRL